MVNQPTITPLGRDADGDRGVCLEWYAGDYYFSIALEGDRKPYIHVMDLENSVTWNFDLSEGMTNGTSGD